MENYNIIIYLLAFYILYKCIFGDFTKSLIYLFILYLLLKLYFNGLKKGGFFYRLYTNDNEYLIRPLKEYINL